MIQTRTEELEARLLLVVIAFADLKEENRKLQGKHMALNTYNNKLEENLAQSTSRSAEFRDKSVLLENLRDDLLAENRTLRAVLHGGKNKNE